MTTFINPIKPRVGALVRLEHAPGIWQLSDKSPHRPGEWWCVGYDAEARAHRGIWGQGFEAAISKEMKSVSR